MKTRLRHALPVILASGCLPTAFAAPPANDDFAAASVATVGVNSGTTVEATTQTGEPATHFQSTLTGKSVWFAFTPVATGLYTATVVGTDATPVTHNVAVYTGTSVTGLTRVASNSIFQGAAGVTYRIQVTGNTNTATGAFDLTLTRQRDGKVVLPFFSNWDFLHPLNGEDPTTDATWAGTWKTPGDATAYGTLSFTRNVPAPLCYGGIDRPPGQATNLGATTGTAASNNNAAYVRTSFTLTEPTSNLWAEILADDGAYIYIDDQPGIPVHIAAKLTAASITTNQGFADFRPQPDVHLTGAIPTTAVAGGPPGCRAYVPTGFNNELSTQMVFLSGLVGKLEAGPHRIAVSVHQTGTGSSDMGVDVQLISFAPKVLPSTGAILTFNETPFVTTSATTAVVPAVEHHRAPNLGQTDLAWYCVSPTTRGATALRQAVVASDTASGAQKALRLQAAEAQRFVTEPISVAGLTQYTVSLKIRTNDTSSGFEAGDGFRVFLETSQDGVNFSEPAVPLEIQPQVNGAAALDPFKAAFVTKAITVTRAPADVATRLVITGGTDSTSEYIYFDDVFFGLCQVTPAVAGLVFDNRGDDNTANDVVTFDLTVAGSGTAATTFTTVGLPGGDITADLGVAKSVTVPVTLVNGVRQAVAFSVQETGNPACTANVSVTPPSGSVSAATVTNVTRSRGPSNATADDDTLSFTINATGLNASTGWQLLSSDATDPTVYASGAYGTDVPVTVKANITPTMIVVDRGEPTIRRNAPLDLRTTEVAVGKATLGGVTRVIYAPAPVAAAATAQWLQASIAATDDADFSPDATSAVLNLANLANSTGTPGTATGTLASETIPLTGTAPKNFTAQFRAFERSTTSGFETDDTFKLELVLTRPGGPETVNLIAGLPADANADGFLNGYTGTTAAPYNNTPSADEFNTVGELIAGNSRGLFSLSHVIPGDATDVTINFVGTNDSGQEYFFVSGVTLTEGTAPVDSDADGLPDSWELQYFGSLSQTPTGDPDGDGQSNLAEYVAGTKPNDAGDRLRATVVSRDGTNVTVTWPSVVGKVYRIQRSTSLASGSWSDIGGSVTATGATTTASRPHDAARAYFYRVVTP